MSESTHDNGAYVSLNAGQWVRVYPGARPGRYYVARVLSPDCEFGGTRCAWVESATGGRDYIAHTHIERGGPAE